MNRRDGERIPGQRCGVGVCHDSAISPVEEGKHMPEMERYRITVKVGRRLWDVELNTFQGIEAAKRRAQMALMVSGRLDRLPVVIAAEKVA
jgi:hypothetical protein